MTYLAQTAPDRGGKTEREQLEYDEREIFVARLRDRLHREPRKEKHNENEKRKHRRIEPEFLKLFGKL